MTKSKEELQKLTKPALLEYAKELGIQDDLSQFSKAEIVEFLFDESAEVEDKQDQELEQPTGEEVADTNDTPEKESDFEEEPAPVENNPIKDKDSVAISMELELAKRRARYATGIAHEGKSSNDAFKAELARRQSRYGKATGEIDNIESAFAQEVARRSTLKK